MSAPRRASVIVVSRDRPALLCRCLRGLSQLDHPAFEIVVVADRAGLATLAGAGLDRGIKTARCDVANISVARNLGLVLAAGEIVAFVDDDAVPESSWLRHLCAAFDAPEVAAAGGFVRGRNGFCFQSKAHRVDRTGRAIPIDDWGPTPRRVRPDPGLGVKTEGTNMAFRRAVLAALGGFDPAFRYYLDETDVNLHLAAEGRETALVPRAEVHHGTAASTRRAADRAPRTLFDIGSSLAVFLRKHADPDSHAAATAAARLDERRRLLRHMVAGGIEPRDVARLMASFESGLAEGRARALVPLPPLGDPVEPFRPFPSRGAPAVLLWGRPWQARSRRAEAARAAAQGARVTLFVFGPHFRRHRLCFTDGGWWEQRGGLFGRSERSGPRPPALPFAARLRHEAARLDALRGAESCGAIDSSTGTLPEPRRLPSGMT